MIPDLSDATEWPDIRILEWILALRAATYLGTWATTHLSLLTAEARFRNLPIPTP